MGPLSLQELFVIIVFGIGLLGLAFWIWMIIDCAIGESDIGNTKIVWILVVILAGIIGAGIYYFVRRPQRRWDTHVAELKASRS